MATYSSSVEPYNTLNTLKIYPNDPPPIKVIDST